MKLNNRKLKKEINQKGYTVIKNFYNKKKIPYIQLLKKRIRFSVLKEEKWKF